MLVFDTENSTASVEEGENATICIHIYFITISSDASVLGFDLTVTLTTVNDKAIGNNSVLFSKMTQVYSCYVNLAYLSHNYYTRRMVNIVGERE